MIAMRSLGWPIVMLVSLIWGDARADLDEARHSFEHGMKAYNIQQFKVALDEFTKAYVEQPDPAFLFNIGQAQRQLGMYAAAAKSYRLFLSNQPGAINRPQVTRLIEQMDAAAATEMREKAAAAPPAAVVTPAPTVYFRARPRRPWYKAPAPWALAALGVAGGAAAAALLGVASIEGERATRATTLADFNTHHSRDLTYQQAGWPLLAVGATSLVVAGVFVAVDARKR